MDGINQMHEKGAIDATFRLFDCLTLSRISIKKKTLNQQQRVVA